MSDDSLTVALDRLLGGVCTPAVLRQIERGGDTNALWASLTDSGFLDALVPESAGGAGLTLAEAFPLFVVEGRHALPLPLAHTMFVRALLERAGLGAPPGPIAIAPCVRWTSNGALSCPGVPYGLVAEWVAAEHPAGWLLLPVQAAECRSTGVHGSLRADLQWPTVPPEALGATQPVAWAEAGAALTAAQLAGAMQRVLELSVAFANQREQFGRSIGKFQALQHQLAVMAEQVTAAHIAAEIGCSAAGPEPAPLRAAMAKARASEAATFAATISHAVHGAIGVTAEFDLQLYSRRLHEWRADFGAEQHWNRVVGRALLSSGSDSALDFMRRDLIPQNHEIVR
jgi:acyl-CoA dehydrogenase